MAWLSCAYFQAYNKILSMSETHCIIQELRQERTEQMTYKDYLN